MIFLLNHSIRLCLLYNNTDKCTRIECAQHIGSLCNFLHIHIKAIFDSIENYFHQVYFLIYVTLIFFIGVFF